MKRYDKYKPSGIDWIGEVPEHWEVVPFKTLFTTDKGLNITKADLVDEGEPVISYGQIHSKLNDYVSVKDDLIRFLPEALAPQDSKSLVHEGDFIFADTSEDVEGCGNCVYIDKEGLFAGYHTIIAKHKAQKDNKYLAYLFTTPHWRSQIRSRVFGVKVYSITKQILTSTNMIVPPKDEQNKIVAYLDARCADIDKVVATQEKRIALLQELKQSEITQAVTRGLNPDARMKDSGVEWIGMVPEHWEVKKLRFLGSTKNGISKGGDYFGKGYPFVSYGDVYKNYALPTMVDGLVESSDEERNDFSVEKGDVFFTRTSETIEEVGFSSVCAKTIKDAVFAGFVIRFRPQKGVLNVGYSKYYFRCDLHRAFFVKEMNLVTRASLSQELLKNLIVLLPPFDEQAAIAEYLDRRCGEIDKQIGAVTKQIDLLREYKQALITEVVTGKRKV